MNNAKFIDRFLAYLQEKEEVSREELDTLFCDLKPTASPNLVKSVNNARSRMLYRLRRDGHIIHWDRRQRVFSYHGMKKRSLAQRLKPYL